MDKGFDDILNTCLDRITQKGDSIEQCLESYPEQAGELEPLLRAALSVQETVCVEPRPEFRQAAKGRLLSALAAKEEGKGKSGSPLWGWQRRWAAAVAVVLALLLIGGGTVTASSNSLPGDMLYPVKTAAEKVQAFFTFGDEARANLYMKFAERRIEEIELLAGRERNVSRSVLGAMHVETDRAISLMDRNESPREELVARLVGLTSNQKMVLARVIKEASPEARQRLRAALNRSEIAHNWAVVIMERIERIPGLEELKIIPSRHSS